MNQNIDLDQSEITLGQTNDPNSSEDSISLNDKSTGYFDPNTGLLKSNFNEMDLEIIKVTPGKTVTPYKDIPESDQETEIMGEP